MKEIGFMQVHIFPYSRREGTIAAKMKQVPGDIKKARCKQAEELAKELKVQYLKTLIGKELEVLIEEEIDGAYEGYSREYVRVRVDKAELHKIIKVKAKDIIGDKIIAEV